MKQLLGKYADKRPYRRILRKCTEFSPKRRYPTAKSLWWALKTQTIQLWLPWLITVVALLSAGTFVWWYHSNQAEITESRYPDEPLLFYALSEDHLIANIGDMRTGAQMLTMYVDMNGNGKKETVRLYADYDGAPFCEVISGIQTADGYVPGKELLSFAAVEVPIADYLTAVSWEQLFENAAQLGPSLPLMLEESLPDGRRAGILVADPLLGFTTFPDELFVQITCLDLNPDENDGKELVISVGDLTSESVSAVYVCTGDEDVAAYRGRFWGGASARLTRDGYLESALQHNPYQGYNTYRYAAESGIYAWDEVDYAKYCYAISGKIMLREWHEALNE